MDFFDDLFNQLYNKGYNMSTIYTYHTTPVGRPAALAASKNETLFTNPNKAYSVLDESEYGGKKNLDKLNKMKTQLYTVEENKINLPEDDLNTVEEVV